MHIVGETMIEIPLETICNTHFLRFLCNHSSFISFRRDDWNKKMKGSKAERLYKAMAEYFVDEYDDYCYLDSEYGNVCNIQIFHMNSIFETYLLLNKNLMQWSYPFHPEDPAFYREDKSCILHINVHEKICFYYPRDVREVIQLKTCGFYNQQECDQLNTILNLRSE